MHVRIIDPQGILVGTLNDRRYPESFRRRLESELWRAERSWNVSPEDDPTGAGIMQYDSDEWALVELLGRLILSDRAKIVLHVEQA